MKKKRHTIVRDGIQESPLSMKQEQTTRDAPPQDRPKFSQAFLDDLKKSDFKRVMHQDLKDVYHFYLDENTRDELSDMGQFSKWMYMSYWLMKSIFLKLTPVRRFLLLIGLYLFFDGTDGEILSLSMGFLLILLILILELKDKLLAQDELAAGRAVQYALMPDQNPKLPGWETWLFTRPANDVGGDFVDYLPVRDDRLGLALGDVAGKGLGAALFMAKLQSTLRAIATHHETLDALGTEINSIFRRDGLPDKFASLLYLEIEPGSGLVRILNAGHLPPILMREGVLEDLSRGAPALGIIDEPQYSEQHINLDAGDYLIVFSDGLTEARNAQGEMFSEERLHRILPKLRGRSVKEIGLLLVEAVEMFIEDERPSDDLSMVLLRRVPQKHLESASE